jgi:hypothetical protein
VWPEELTSGPKNSLRGVARRTHYPVGFGPRSLLPGGDGSAVGRLVDSCVGNGVGDGVGSVDGSGVGSVVGGDGSGNGSAVARLDDSGVGSGGVAASAALTVVASAASACERRGAGWRTEEAREADV